MGVSQDFARRGGILQCLRGFRGNLEDLGEFCGYLVSVQDFRGSRDFVGVWQDFAGFGEFCRISGGQGGLR